MALVCTMDLESVFPRILLKLINVGIHEVPS
jgi:hypothetical protein